MILREWMIMKGSVKWNAVQSWPEFHFQQNSNFLMLSRKHAYIILTPLNPLLYIKIGIYRGIQYFSYFSKNIHCGSSLELPCWGSSNENSQSMFWEKIWKISEFFICKFSFFFGCKIFNIFEWYVFVILWPEDLLKSVFFFFFFFFFFKFFFFSYVTCFFPYFQRHVIMLTPLSVYMVVTQSIMTDTLIWNHGYAEMSNLMSPLKKFRGEMVWRYS